MKLRRLFIKQFKNLENFEITFDDSKNNTVVFIGENGSGKSNVLEALVLIFRNLYLLDSEKPAFDFEISYLCRDKEVSIITASDTKERYVITVDGEPYTLERLLRGLESSYSGKEENILPDNIITYYSGITKRLEQLFESHEKQFSKELRKFSEPPIRPLFYTKPFHFPFISGEIPKPEGEE